MQKNSIYFIIIFLIGILANYLVVTDDHCNHRNYEKCKEICSRRGVKKCEQKHGKIKKCECRHH